MWERPDVFLKPADADAKRPLDGTDVRMDSADNGVKSVDF